MDMPFGSQRGPELGICVCPEPRDSGEVRKAATSSPRSKARSCRNDTQLEKSRFTIKTQPTPEDPICFCEAFGKRLRGVAGRLALCAEAEPGVGESETAWRLHATVSCAPISSLQYPRSDVRGFCCAWPRTNRGDGGGGRLRLGWMLLEREWEGQQLDRRCCGRLAFICEGSVVFGLRLDGVHVSGGNGREMPLGEFDLPVASNRPFGRVETPHLLPCQGP